MFLSIYELQKSVFSFSNNQIKQVKVIVSLTKTSLHTK